MRGAAGNGILQHEVSIGLEEVRWTMKFVDGRRFSDEREPGGPRGTN